MNQNKKSINIINEIYNQIQNLLKQDNNQQDNHSNIDEIVNIISENCQNYVHTLNPERIETINQIVKYFKDYKDNNNHNQENAQITFACVQNSRRSHFAEIWFYISLIKNEINWIETYSGGTEATSCNYRVIHSLRRFGISLNEINNNDKYEILNINSKSNQLYNLNYNENVGTQNRDNSQVITQENNKEHLIFSKIYNDKFNPQKDFCAVLVCADDDTNCPAIFGSNGIFHLAFIDPKLADDTSLEQETYDKKSIEIGLEMMFIANSIN